MSIVRQASQPDRRPGLWHGRNGEIRQHLHVDDDVCATTSSTCSTSAPTPCQFKYDAGSTAAHGMATKLANRVGGHGRRTSLGNDEGRWIAGRPEDQHHRQRQADQRSGSATRHRHPGGRSGRPHRPDHDGGTTVHRDDRRDDAAIDPRLEQTDWKGDAKDGTVWPLSQRRLRQAKATKAQTESTSTSINNADQDQVERRRRGAEPDRPQA